jgi:hypothetical protein
VDLDGDFAVVLEVQGEIDRPHAALAQLTLDPVAVRQGGGQPHVGRRPQAETKACAS